MTQPIDSADRVLVEADGIPLSDRRQATIALLVAAAMQAFDLTIVNVALPRVEESFGGGIGLGSWIMTAYLCAAAVSTPLAGWLARRNGAKQLLSGAISAFVAASLFCALAPNAFAMITFRVLQGAAGGILLPVTQSALLDIHPKPGHGRILAILGATVMTGPVLGPTVGGLITDLASWRWIFAINIPLGLIAISGLRWLPSKSDTAPGARIDHAGIVFLILGVGALQLLLQQSAGSQHPSSGEIVAEATVTVLALAAIGIQAVRRRFLLFKLEVFRDPNFTISIFYNFVVGGLVTTTIIFLPALGEGPFSYDATIAGVIISPRGVMTLLTMLAISRVIDRLELRLVLTIGLVMTAGAFEMMAGEPIGDEALWLAGASALQGVGVGLLFTPLSTLAFSTIARELRADGSGVYFLLRQLGAASGVAVMSGVLQARFHANLVSIGTAEAIGKTTGAIVSMALTRAYSDSFQIMAIVALVVIPGVLLFRPAKSAADRGIRA